MSFKLYLLFIQLPVMVWACASDLGGSSSKSAEFGISFFAPLAYTYPPDGVDVFTGYGRQSMTFDMANSTVKKDLDLAVAKGLTANQIYLYIPPTIDFTFKPPQIQITDGNKCTADNTYVAIKGTVIYKCAGGAAPVTDAPGDQTTVEGSTETTVTDSTTTGPTAASQATTQSSGSKIKGYPFTQTMTVTATASQALFENQWKQIARSVQQALEAKKLLFNDEIEVILL